MKKILFIIGLIIVIVGFVVFILILPRPSYVDNQFIKSCKGGNLEQAIAYLNQGARINIIDEDGYRPMDYIIQRGNIKLVETFIKKGGKLQLSFPEELRYWIYNIIFKKGWKGQNILFAAVKSGNIEVVKYCLINNIRPKLDYDKNNLIHIACKNSGIDILQLLIKDLKIDINYSNKAGYTPLFNSVLYENVQAFKYLVKQDCDLYKTNREGYNILHYAVTLKKKRAIWMILKYGNNFDYKLPVDSKLLQKEKDDTRYFYTTSFDNIITLALKQDSLDILKYLLNNGVSPETPINYILSRERGNHDDRMFTYFIKKQNFRMAYFLLYKGAKVYYKDLAIVADKNFRLFVFIEKHYSFKKNDYLNILYEAARTKDIQLYNYLFKKYNYDYSSAKFILYGFAEGGYLKDFMKIKNQYKIPLTADLYNIASTNIKKAIEPEITIIIKNNYLYKQMKYICDTKGIAFIVELYKLFDKSSSNNLKYIIDMMKLFPKKIISEETRSSYKTISEIYESYIEEHNG